MVDMEQQKRRKQVFYEIGGGKLALEAQDVFEKIQALAQNSNQPITMGIKIVVKPPAAGDHFGRTQFSISHSEPAVKSIEYTTEYEGGFAIKDGDGIDGILQTSLELPDTNHPGKEF